MQHGLLDLRFADISDAALLAKVRGAATDFINDKNMLQYSNTVKRINELKKLTSLD
jgi:hypothetical protein